MGHPGTPCGVESESSMAEALTKAGRYQIVGELGRGSMGVVYQGFDPIIGRTVAIKTMLTEGLAGPEFQEYKARFQREAQAAGVLAHPNIVTVYDFGEDNGVLYLAMEFLEGKSLEQLVEEQHLLPVETIVPIFEQVCGALDHAHRNKIVHRDIKPANIMVLDNGLVKVTDFGIAKMMSMGMTQAGQILGTPNYMSPEQVKGRPIDGRSDIFSLGVILYELITGEKPFGGQNITTVIYKIINENPPPPRELDATIHMGLSYVIQKSLAKNSDERYQTCRELAEDLRNYKNLGGMAAPSATVVMKIPQAPVMAVQPTPAPVPTPVPEQARPMSVQVIPPVASRQSGTSPVVWVLFTLLFAFMIGGGYYFLKIKPSQQSSREIASPTVTPGSSPSTAPTSEVVPPAETATTTPPNTAPASESPAPPPVVARTEPKTPAPTATRAAAAPKVGRLIVTSNVDGAKISIDGRSDPDWVTPYTIADLPAGEHKVVVSKNGFEDANRSVTVPAGNTEPVRLELSSPRGEISIITIPAGIEILIDGQSQGPSPVRVTVGAGPHKYSIKRPGAAPFESTFEMKSGSIITRKVDLSGGAAAPTGTVSLKTTPPGASVYADGAPVGGQTPTSFRLSAGRHTMTISLAGYRAVRREVEVPPDGLATVNEVLNHQ
jgi:eukaryotic-like serine/threonine-protein kinase